MNNEEFIDHIALHTLLESLRKVTHPMGIEDTRRLAYLAYATGEAMLEKKQKLLKKFADQKARESTDLIHLNLTLRTLYALMGDDIYTIERLTQCTEKELLRIPNLGRKALNEIKDGLSANGLKLKDGNEIAADSKGFYGLPSGSASALNASGKCVTDGETSP
jgi:hypothetical protein